jgi:hypothetical protein
LFFWPNLSNASFGLNQTKKVFFLRYFILFSEVTLYLHRYFTQWGARQSLIARRLLRTGSLQRTVHMHDRRKERAEIKPFEPDAGSAAEGKV